MRKNHFIISISLLLTVLLGGCGLLSKSAQLAKVEIIVDGDPAEWKPFPVVYEDPEHDNISIDFDLSNLKAFTNSETGQMYILAESYITPKELTTVEIDLKYGDTLYRVGLPTGERMLGAMAKQNADGTWETITDELDFMIATAEATELSFSTEYFPNAGSLKIAKFRLMGGICCNTFEYFAIDYLD